MKKTTIPEQPEELSQPLARLSPEDRLPMLIMANRSDRPCAFVHLQESCEHSESAMARPIQQCASLTQ